MCEDVQTAAAKREAAAMPLQRNDPSGSFSSPAGRRGKNEVTLRRARAAIRSERSPVNRAAARDRLAGSLLFCK